MREAEVLPGTAEATSAPNRISSDRSTKLAEAAREDGWDGGGAAREYPHPVAPYLDADGSNTRLKRLMLAAASALVTVNIWTGAPLIALWASSVIVDEKQLSMKALLIVVVVMGAILTAAGVCAGATQRCV